jgi:hypothetical protein
LYDLISVTFLVEQELIADSVPWLYVEFLFGSIILSLLRRFICSSAVQSLLPLCVALRIETGIQVLLQKSNGEDHYF